MNIGGISKLGGKYPAEQNIKNTTARKSNGVSFAEVAATKEEEKIVDYDEKAFETVGPNAPQEVKDAWMEAAKEVNANGVGIQGNGMMSHISQMMVQRLTKMLKGETDYSDILGNTVESAIRATKQALYDLDHPLSPGHRSIEAQQGRMKEREFYIAFLDKLGAVDSLMNKSGN